MIRVNLLKQSRVQPVSVSALVAPSSGKKTGVFVLLAVLLVGVGVFFYFNQDMLPLPDGKEMPVVEAPVPALTPPVPTRPQAKPVIVTVDAVEEIVKEIQQEVRLQPRRIGYSDLAPSQKVQYQQMAAKQLLRQLKNITPAEVGFANLVFTLPGDFYVHGMAYDFSHYERFKQELGTIGGSLKSGILKPIGDRGISQEFSFYGKVDYQVSPASGEDRILGESEVPAELQSLRRTASNLGIQMTIPSLATSSPWGAYKRKIYKTEAKCDYQQLESLFSQMQVERSHVGLVKFALRATGDEQVNASLDLMLYTN